MTARADAEAFVNAPDGPVWCDTCRSHTKVVSGRYEQHVVMRMSAAQPRGRWYFCPLGGERYRRKLRQKCPNDVCYLCRPKAWREAVEAIVEADR